MRPKSLILMLYLADAIVIGIKTQKKGTAPGSFVQAEAGLWLLAIASLTLEEIVSGFGLVFMLIASVQILVGQDTKAGQPAGVAIATANIVASLFGQQAQVGTTAGGQPIYVTPGSQPAGTVLT